MEGAAFVRSFAFQHGPDLLRKENSPPKGPPAAPFKRLPGASLFPLPPVPQRVADWAGRPAAVSPDLELAFTLSSLCGYTLGVLSYHLTGPYPLHRGTPSARCLYPTELYAVIAGEELPGPGLYRYDPLSHGLERLRGAESLPHLRQALGLATIPEVTLLVTSAFWRIAHLYGDFGYRLCALEAGMVGGQLFRFASAMGWSVSVHEQIEDQIVAALCGVDPVEEGPMLALTLQRSDMVPRRYDRPPLAEPLASLPWQEEAAVRHACPGIVRMQQYALNERRPTQEQEQEPASEPECGTEHDTIPLPVPPSPASDLADLSRRRNSGFEWAGLNPLSRAIPLDGLAQVLLRGRGYAGGISVYLLALQVEGLNPGVYRYLPGKHALSPINHSRDLSQSLERLVLVQGVNPHSLSHALFLTADLDSFLAHSGTRGYRLLHARAGAMAQEMCLLSAESGLFARPFLAIDPLEAASVLHLTQTGHQLIYSLLCGTNRLRPPLGQVM